MTRRLKIRRSGAAVLVGLLLGACQQPASGRHSGLQGGASSIGELLNQMVSALNTKDRGALENLRVTEEEYRGIIIPGHAEPGHAPQRIGEEAAEYFWGVLDTRSRFNAAGLLGNAGGQGLEVVDWSFTKGVKTYAGYTAHRRLELRVKSLAGSSEEIATGSIAEVDGRFKFISFIRD